MISKEYSNKFRFTLHQGDVLLCENMFDADQFNPLTRYSIDIRDILPRSITKLQKTLSKRNYSTQLTADLDLYEHHLDMIELYDSDYYESMVYSPQSIVQTIEDRGEVKTIRGVECKIGLYINDKPIVERVFYVDGFNIVSRWSLDIVDVVNDIVNVIYQKIKKTDIKNMWDDYDLINIKGLSISQIRELPLYKREELLRKLYI